MKTYFLGSDRICSDFLMPLIPVEYKPQLLATGTSSISLCDMLVTCDLQRFLSLAAFEEFVKPARFTVIIFEHGIALGHRTEIPDWLRAGDVILPENIACLCFDAALFRQLKSRNEVYFLPFGVPSGGIRPARSYSSEEPVTITLTGYNASTSELILLEETIKSVAQTRAPLFFETIRLEQETSLNDLITQICRADILIDNLETDRSPGLATYLALAQGISVICNNTSAHSAEAFTHERLSPVIDANKENIAAVLSSLLHDTRTLRDLDKRGREYIRAYHREEFTQIKLRQLLDSRFEAK